MSDLFKDEEEELFRHIHPSFFLEGKPTSQAFMPTKKDGRLSVDRSSMISAEESFLLYKERGRDAECTYCLSVGELKEHDLGCISDPIEGRGSVPPNPAHCYADMSGIPEGKQKKIAKRLKEKAAARGRRYPI